MLTVTSVVGNIFEDKKLMDKFKQMESLKLCERLKIPRLEMEKSRMRKKTDLGTDIGLVLDTDKKLLHGDVLVSNSKRFVIVEQLPEKTISIKIKKTTGESLKLLVILGHMIGNRHKPIVIHDDIVSFPIQTDSEVDVFKKLLSEFIGKIEIKVEEQIFQPQRGMYMHEH